MKGSSMCIVLAVTEQAANRQWSCSLGKTPHHKYHVTKCYTGLCILAYLFLEQLEQWWHLEDKRNTCGILVGKREGERPLGTCRTRWEDTIKMELIEIGWEDVDCINLVQGRENLLAVPNVWNFLVAWTVICWGTGHQGVGQSVSRLVSHSAQSAN